MRIQVLLQWGFVFIYPSLMNMNLHLDREVSVPTPLWTLHTDFPHPDLLPPSPRWGIGYQTQGCNCPSFSSPLDFAGALPGAPNDTPPPPGPRSGDADAGSADPPDTQLARLCGVLSTGVDKSDMKRP